MTKKSAAFLLFCFLALIWFMRSDPYTLASQERANHSQASPDYWELRIYLNMKGYYEAKEGEKDYTGQFTYASQWTGCLEKDESDFLIYYENEKLLEWKAQEKAKGLNGSRTLPTEEFSEKPGFEFSYILRKEDQFHFDFFVTGFNVPQSASKFKHRLILPATAENTERMFDNFYSHHISKGSNRIQIPQQSFFDKRSSFSFSWTWEEKRWTKKEDKVVFFSHSHDVDVELTIIPHFK